MSAKRQHLVTVIINNDSYEFEFEHKENLRSGLLKRGISPYGMWSKKINCGGNGICATCGVWFVGTPIEPKHWHDKLANAFIYPRLSCQIMVTKPITIRLLPNKRLWGKILPF